MAFLIRSTSHKSTPVPTIGICCQSSKSTSGDIDLPIVLPMKEVLPGLRNDTSSMHIPDGFLTPPVWGTLDAISAPAVAWVARRAQRNTQDQQIPLLGVM